jgi:hypothetical protein
MLQSALNWLVENRAGTAEILDRLATCSAAIGRRTIPAGKMLIAQLACA